MLAGGEVSAGGRGGESISLSSDASLSSATFSSSAPSCAGCFFSTNGTFSPISVSEGAGHLKSCEALGPCDALSEASLLTLGLPMRVLLAHGMVEMSEDGNHGYEEDDKENNSKNRECDNADLGGGWICYYPESGSGCLLTTSTSRLKLMMKLQQSGC